MTDSDKHDDSKHPSEMWTCAGVRSSFSNPPKRAIAWVDVHGVERRYMTPRKSFVLGGIYEASVERRLGPEEGSDDKVSLYGDPSPYLGQNPDVSDEQRRAWRVAEIDAEQRLSAATRERKDGALDALDEALEPLLQLMRTHTHAETESLIAYALRRMNAAAIAPRSSRRRKS